MSGFCVAVIDGCLEYSKGGLLIKRIVLLFWDDLPERVDRVFVKMSFEICLPEREPSVRTQRIVLRCGLDECLQLKDGFRVLMFTE